jgi:hypothetical protein
MLKYILIIGVVLIAFSSCKKNEDAIQNTVVTAPAINNIKKHQPVVITGSNSVNDSIVWQVQPTTNATFTTNVNTATFIFNAAGVYTIFAKTTTITTKFMVTVNDSDYNAKDQYFYYTIYSATDSTIKKIEDTLTATFNQFYDTTQFPAVNYIEAVNGQFGTQNYVRISVAFANKDTSFRNASFTNNNSQDTALNYQQSSTLKITRNDPQIGGYIEGNFTGVYKKDSFDIEEKTIKGNFRIKRKQ